MVLAEEAGSETSTPAKNVLQKVQSLLESLQKKVTDVNNDIMK